MICRVSSADLFGAGVFEVCVEADVSGGLPGFYIVGLPSSEVKEAKERVIRAIVNSGFSFPARKITINLSPAYIPKHGSCLDLPIAIAILAAMGEIPEEALVSCMFEGELSLDGSINRINGALPIAGFAFNKGYEALILPEKNAFEGAAVKGLRIHEASSLRQIATDLKKGIKRDVDHIDLNEILEDAYTDEDMDFADIYGQESAKKATLTAAAGFHNILYIGPPGAGKSMMARRIPTIIGRMSAEECLEVSSIYSIAGLLENEKLITRRPFRSPGQGITEAALMGGTASLKPGEITLAHRGVLFLDELTEFSRKTIDLLRIPLESEKTVINRAHGSCEYPCSFMLAASTNPCACGYYPDRRYCRCTESEVSRYLGKLRGPVMDRIDICVGMSRVDAKYLEKGGSGLSSKEMREMVVAARNMQKERFRNTGILFNSQMDRKMVNKHCQLETDALSVLNSAYEKLNMTARGWYKVLKVSRTIADLEEEENISKKHVLEAISYRNQFPGS